MHWYQLTALAAFIFCLAVCAFHLIRIIRLGRPVDYAIPAGSIPEGVKYSFTSGMNPKKKESAFLHLPTYFGGIIYHIGIFTGILIFLLLIIFPTLDLHPALLIPAVIPAAGGIAGAALLVKRVKKPMLRNLSTPDDYISNVLVTLFQLILALSIVAPGMKLLFYLLSTLLWIYFPAGKLKHAIYFFAARYYLGLFFGSRGVWTKGHNS